MRSDTITMEKEIAELEANEQAMNDAHTAMALEVGRLGRLLGEAEAREQRLQAKLITQIEAGVIPAACVESCVVYKLIT